MPAHDDLKIKWYILPVISSMNNEKRKMFDKIVSTMIKHNEYLSKEIDEFNSIKSFHSLIPHNMSLNYRIGTIVLSSKTIGLIIFSNTYILTSLTILPKYRKNNYAKRCVKAIEKAILPLPLLVIASDKIFGFMETINYVPVYNKPIQTYGTKKSVSKHCCRTFFENDDIKDKFFCLFGDQIAKNLVSLKEGEEDKKIYFLQVE
jgi:hypothetical protein